MDRRFLIAAPLALLAGSASAAEPAQPSAAFAAEAIRICIDTRADPASVRQLAEAEKWVPIDTKGVGAGTRIVLEGKKKKDRLEFGRTHAWTFEKDGMAVTVGLFDFPEHPQVKQCELIAWDLDFAAVSSALASDPRFTGGGDQGLPMRMYHVSETGMAVSYLASDTGAKMVHLVTANSLR